MAAYQGAQYGHHPQYHFQQQQQPPPPPQQFAAAPAAPASYAERILNPGAPAAQFAFTDFLRKEYRFGLDPTRRTCPLFVQGHCPLGNACPDKHAVSSTFNNLVCKHWLRSLCKKGEGCEFLHEYNLCAPPPPPAPRARRADPRRSRKMPECNFFVRNGYCSNGEECLYLHVDPDSKVPRCAHYDNGFCALGPRCARKHARAPLPLCRFFLAGFCPDGRACRAGAHPKWAPPAALPPPALRRPRDPVDAPPPPPPAWDARAPPAFGRRKFFGAGGNGPAGGRRER